MERKRERCRVPASWSDMSESNEEKNSSTACSHSDRLSWIDGSKVTERSDTERSFLEVVRWWRTSEENIVHEKDLRLEKLLIASLDINMKC